MIHKHVKGLQHDLETALVNCQADAEQYRRAIDEIREARQHYATRFEEDLSESLQESKPFIDVDRIIGLELTLFEYPEPGIRLVTLLTGNYAIHSLDDLVMPVEYMEGHPPETVEDFKAKLNELHMEEWSECYRSEDYGVDISGGCGWELEIHLEDTDETVRFSGINAWPYNFPDLQELMNWPFSFRDAENV